MEEIKNNKSITKSYLYYIILFLFINVIKSFTYFQAFSLFKDIILITDEGIFKYDPSTGNNLLIQSTNVIASQLDLDYVSFAQFPIDDGGYVLIRLKKYVYVFNEALSSYIGHIEVGNIDNFYSVIKTYKTLEGKNTIIISYINKNQI